MSNFNPESVLSVHHWTDTLFSFTTTRDSSFRFRNGEFTMIGLKACSNKKVERGYAALAANRWFPLLDAAERPRRCWVT
jgi:ferredoxin--NADP+ reductase